MLKCYQIILLKFLLKKTKFIYSLVGFLFQFYTKLTYMIVVGLLGIATIVVVMWEKFNQPEYRTTRAAVFVSLVTNSYLLNFCTKTFLVSLIFKHKFSVVCPKRNMLSLFNFLNLCLDPIRYFISWNIKYSISFSGSSFGASNSPLHHSERIQGKQSFRFDR